MAVYQGTGVRGITQRVGGRKDGYLEANLKDDAKRVQRALKALGYEAGQYQGFVTTNAPLAVFASVAGKA